MKDILEKYVADYNKKFEFYLISCKWKLHFWILSLISNLIDYIIFIYPVRKLRSNLISKIDDFESVGHKLSHIRNEHCVYIKSVKYDIPTLSPNTKADVRMDYN